MTNVDSLNEWQRLLLMAASAHGLGPTTNLDYANTAKVVQQSLVWADVMHGDVQEAWGQCEYCPTIEECYGTLIAMIRNEPPSEALFQGQGNLGSPTEPPTFPHYTSCRLTARGARLAEQLLERHPEYRDIDQHRRIPPGDGG